MDPDDAPRAATLYEQSLALRRELGDKEGIAASLSNLGLVARQRGDPHRALALIKGGLELYWDLGNKLGVAACLERLAGVAGVLGQPEQAARLWGAAASLRRSLGAPFPAPPADLTPYRRDVAAVGEALGADRLRGAWTAGEVLALDRAIDDALHIEG